MDVLDSELGTDLDFWNSVLVVQRSGLNGAAFANRVGFWTAVDRARDLIALSPDDVLVLFEVVGERTKDGIPGGVQAEHEVSYRRVERDSPEWINS